MIPRDLQIEMSWFSWLCGLLEGEGTFVRGSPAKPRRPSTAIGMVDKDVIQHVCDLWGTRLYHIAVKDPRHQAVFRTELVGGSAVALMRLLRPEMSQRRQAQIDAAIASYQPLRSIRHKTYTLLPRGKAERERYWLAGYLEGEGAFTHNRGSPMVEVNTVDADIIERVQSIWMTRYYIVVNIHTRPPRQEGYQRQYHLACYGNAARAVMADVAPLLGARRRARIAELIGAAAGGLREAGVYYELCRAA